MRLRLDILAPSCLCHGDPRLEKVSHDLIDIAADVTNFGELGGLHLQEGRIGELGKPAGNLCLADARRADHQNVLWHYLVPECALQLLSPPAVAQGDGNRALGLSLSDDMAVELRNDLTRGKVGHVFASTQAVARVSIVRLLLV